MLDALTATSICPGPGGTRSKATNSIDFRSPGVRICRRMPSVAWSTMVVLPLLGAQRRGAQPRRVPLVVAPGGLVFVGSAQQLACQLLDVGLLVDVDLGGAQVRILGADHPQQAAQPALLEIGAVIGQHRSGRCGSRHTAAASRRRSRAVRGRCAPDGATYSPPRAADSSSGSPSRRGPVSTTTPVDPPAPSWARSRAAVATWSACTGQ